MASYNGGLKIGALFTIIFSELSQFLDVFVTQVVWSNFYEKINQFRESIDFTKIYQHFSKTAIFCAFRQSACDFLNCNFASKISLLSTYFWAKIFTKNFGIHLKSSNLLLYILTKCGQIMVKFPKLDGG